jgi:ketoreductase RED1
VVEKMIDDIEAVYGVGEEVYQQLAVRRDRRTKAVLKALKDTP